MVGTLLNTVDLIGDTGASSSASGRAVSLALSPPEAEHSRRPLRRVKGATGWLLSHAIRGYFMRDHTSVLTTGVPSRCVVSNLIVSVSPEIEKRRLMSLPMSPGKSALSR